MRIIVACDHAGLEAKNALVQYLKEKGCQVADFGPKKYDKTDDYPDFVVPAIKRLQSEPDSKAVVLCKNGVGVSLLANKFKGIRAAVSFNLKHTQSARTDDNINVLAIPTDYLLDEEICELTQTFLDTDFSNLERHKRRLQKVALREEENFK